MTDATEPVVRPTLKFHGNLCTPNMVLECVTLSPNTSTNKLYASLTICGDYFF